MTDIKYNGLTALLKNDNTSNNVLFVSRKEDVSYREMFLQAISGVVSNISFWCLDRTECLENEAEREAFYDDLEHMKLVVVPVTTDFLFYANYAKDIVIPYCLKKHIPLLPVMMEPGLADDFNQICGDIQFLEYTQYDSTAISFEIKLANFLKNVLISEAHIKEIKDIFASYIFLSYRKKDRRDAQKVMQQIHNYANCEDVAIWYDEFLTPGENFNTSILEALKKSQLFALVVTPNLLEEENYVARIEYPEALKLGKAVLPVLAKPTDYMKLYEMFHLSQECIKEPQNLSGDLTQLKGSD
ncbi:MAG: toll/interleukin-1 receptor domain-containing protein, partial [Lachnospiraceae bacterium]|nr:toll/interleukin-1 receptor domain-containing protein [Lachnospiraceae bacterium]